MYTRPNLTQLASIKMSVSVVGEKDGEAKLKPVDDYDLRMSIINKYAVY